MSIWGNIEVDEFNFVQVFVVEKQFYRFPATDWLEFCLLNFLILFRNFERFRFNKRAAAK